VFVTELGQQTHCALYFLVIYFLFLYFCLFRDVGALNETLQTLKHLAEHIKTSVLEFQTPISGCPQAGVLGYIEALVLITSSSTRSFFQMKPSLGCNFIDQKNLP